MEVKIIGNLGFYCIFFFLIFAESKKNIILTASSISSRYAGTMRSQGHCKHSLDSVSELDRLCHGLCFNCKYCGFYQWRN